MLSLGVVSVQETVEIVVFLLEILKTARLVEGLVSDGLVIMIKNKGFFLFPPIVRVLFHIAVVIHIFYLNFSQLFLVKGFFFLQKIEHTLVSLFGWKYFPFLKLFGWFPVEPFVHVPIILAYFLGRLYAFRKSF